MSALGRPPVIADIVEEHFDEADFLWEHREDNVFTDDWALADLAHCEARAEAHLDGLRLAQRHGVDLARRRLPTGRSAAMAATLVLVDAHSAPWAEGGELDALAAALRTAAVPVVDGIRLALRHRSRLADALGRVLQELELHDDPLRAAAAADVLAFWRRPVDVRGVVRLLDAEPATARELALGIAARTGKLDDARLTAAAADAEPTVRRAAFAAGAVAALPRLAGACRSAALRQTDPDPEAIAMLGVLGDPADEAALRGLVARQDIRGAAVAALGRLGRTNSVPMLLELMADDAVGATATAAYRRITGATDVEGERPLAPPRDDRDDEALPPDPQKAARDWERRRAQLTTDKSWQCGVAIESALPAPFDLMPLSVRRDVWLRLSARKAALPPLELQALAPLQRAVAGAR